MARPTRRNLANNETLITSGADSSRNL